MQGYILSMQKMRNEDMIVKILTPMYIKTLYRFYGARHSIINIGRKIDFEEESNLTFLPKLKHILHLGYKWESDTLRYYVWQHFIKLLHKHLFDVHKIDEFYFTLLEEGAQKLCLQNPKRVVLEMYAKILHFEGRVPSGQEHFCFVCEEALAEKISLARGFLFAHHSCIGGSEFNSNEILQFLHSQSSILLDDWQVGELWGIIGLGL
ncbi:MAG: recombination protein RecO [Helicobacter sp.]|uniref:recombination protein RecO n=1 Tax=Helicobacter sp. TaxID=218 RepID=UPI0025C27559|nr:recombination protein RecO [Helicobacter sp.]MCH5313124.1 recombination protein RecO [Helicobacter sp.]